VKPKEKYFTFLKLLVFLECFSGLFLEPLISLDAEIANRTPDLAGLNCLLQDTFNEK
jgi:hypothetical protein